MGLYDELYRINSSIISEKEQQKLIKEAERLERIKENEIKENKRRLESDIKKIIKSDFIKYSQYDIDKIKKCYTLQYYNKLLNDIYIYYTKTDKNNYTTIKYKALIDEIYEQNYYIILNKLKKQIEYNDAAIKEENKIYYKSINDVILPIQPKTKKSFWDTPIMLFYFINKILK